MTFFIIGESETGIETKTYKKMQRQKQSVCDRIGNRDRDRDRDRQKHRDKRQEEPDRHTDTDTLSGMVCLILLCIFQYAFKFLDL